FIFLSAGLLLLTGCGNNGRLRHCVTVPKDALTSFSSEEEQRLFDTFNIVVPKEETEVYVHSFSRRYSEFLGSYHEIYFTLELGGVKNYDAFYAANTGRIDENGLYGKAMNQFMDNGSDYYLAYQEFFVDTPRFLKENDNQAIFDSFNELYESMA
ncbi:MAG: hypothetical protein K2J77_11535, partial [Oscillospiraceae bacterium]|nr:hypothetical protein [Oscillospiraceae bacterium]